MQSNMLSVVSAPEPGPGAVGGPVCSPEQAWGPLHAGAGARLLSHATPLGSPSSVSSSGAQPPAPRTGEVGQRAERKEIKPGKKSQPVGGKLSPGRGK